MAKKTARPSKGGKSTLVKQIEAGQNSPAAAPRQPVIPLDEGGNTDVMRITYLPISDERKNYMKNFKLDMNRLFAMFKPGPNVSAEEARLWAVARTHLEAASMFAVKAITSQVLE
jgi:hypothetical protein